MEIPGEQLLIRLWETLAEKGIGGLLQPWQIRRVGKAQTDVECDKIRCIAQAEKYAEDIRSGRIPQQALLTGPDFDTDNLALPPPKQRIEPVFETPLEVARRQEAANALYRQVNIAKAILHAEEALGDDPQAPPEEQVDKDWLFKWQQGAGEVSSEKLQQLWGRLLAGEIKVPGRYSLRCLDFLRNLLSKEALDIARLGPFVVDFDSKHPFIWEENPAVGSPVRGLEFDFLLKMQDLGILSGLESLGLSLQIKGTGSSIFLCKLTLSGKALVVTHENPERTIQISCISVTELGKEILSLGTFEPNMAYLHRLGQFIARNGFTVEIGDYEVDQSGNTKFFNMKPVTLNEQPKNSDT